MARKQMTAPPEEGAPAPEFSLPAAQGGQFRLGLRTARGPVIIVFYRGGWSEECVEYFKALAVKEREINVAGATLAGVGAVEPEAAREFARATGFKSYILYDYLRATTREYGLLQSEAEHGDAARPAAFLVGGDHTVLRAWLDDRPSPEELLAEVSGVTGLPKEPEEEAAEEEKPARRPRKAVKSEDTGDEAAAKGSGREEDEVGKGEAGASSGAASGGSGGSDSPAKSGNSPEKRAAPDSGSAESGDEEKNPRRSEES